MSARIYLLGLLMLAGTLAAVAQDDDKPAPFRRPESSYSRDTVNPNKDELKGFQQKKKFDISKLLIEPNVQLYFTSNYYQFGLMPSLGYNVWKNLYVGGSINYNLVYEPHWDGTPATSSINVQVYGGGPFVHYKIWKGFFTRLRFEMLAVRYPDIDPYSYQVSYTARGIPYIWFGAGYNLTASKNFFIPVAVYVNPLYGTYDGTARTESPYTSWVYFQVAFYIISPH
jgi:hypothetical protein